jgi:hypothetical protein
MNMVLVGSDGHKHTWWRASSFNVIHNGEMCRKVRAQMHKAFNKRS